MEVLDPDGVWILVGGTPCQEQRLVCDPHGTSDAFRVQAARLVLLWLISAPVVLERVKGCTPFLESRG